jgi:hypothetical protein
MTKSVYWGSLLITLTLILGSLLAPQSFIMTFVSTDGFMVGMRFVLVALMLALIVTNPPRSHTLRALLASASFVFFAWAINYALSGTIALADAVLFLHASISFAISAIEPSTVRQIEVEDNDSENEVPVRVAATV